MENYSVSAPRIARIILYVKNIPRVADFYERFFNMRMLPGATNGWKELGWALR